MFGAVSSPDIHQVSLLSVPPSAPSSKRTTSKGIAPGDIVEVDRKGRRFHAVVTSVEQRESGFHDLGLRPLDGRTTYRSATVREVVGVWRKVSRPAPAARPGA